MNSSSELEIYKEFFVNGSVAWFTAGIVAPLFVSNINIRSLIASLISVLLSFIFLRIAVTIRKQYGK